MFPCASSLWARTRIPFGECNEKENKLLEMEHLRLDVCFDNSGNQSVLLCVRYKAWDPCAEQRKSRVSGCVAMYVCSTFCLARKSSDRIRRERDERIDESRYGAVCSIRRTPLARKPNKLEGETAARTGLSIKPWKKGTGIQATSFEHGLRG